MMKTEENRQAELFKVLSVESRIRIINLLKRKGPLGVNELSEALGITPSAVSQHLKILRFAGLVRCERKGYWLPYEIDMTALYHCRRLLSNVCHCGCTGSCRHDQSAHENPENEIVLLKEYERELREELNQVQARIRNLEAAE